MCSYVGRKFVINILYLVYSSVTSSGFLRQHSTCQVNEIRLIESNISISDLDKFDRKTDLI